MVVVAEATEDVHADQVAVEVEQSALRDSGEGIHFENDQEPA